MSDKAILHGGEEQSRDATLAVRRIGPFVDKSLWSLVAVSPSSEEHAKELAALSFTFVRHLEENTADEPTIIRLAKEE